MLKPGYFVVTKQSGYNTEGRCLSASQCARTLLDRNTWMISAKSSGQESLVQGAHIAVYLSGKGEDCGKVMATAEVKSVRPWKRRDKFNYPLMLEAEPGVLLELENVNYLDSPTVVRDCLDNISFIPANKSKWGAAFMRSLRLIQRRDFELLAGDEP